MSIKETALTKTSTGGKPGRGRKPGAIYFPRHSLTRALIIAETIWKDNGGDPYSRLSLAKSLQLSPTGSPFAQLLASSFRYGLTEGSYVSEKISLTALGKSIVDPTVSNDTKAGLRAALTAPELFQKIFSRFDQKPIPKEEVFKNTLLLEFKLPRADLDACYKIVLENIVDYGLAQDIKGTKYLQLDLLAPPVISSSKPTNGEAVAGSEQLEKPVEVRQTLAVKETPKQIFVAHGKNRRPLEQLERMLTKIKVPYKVAQEEPNTGRPVSMKVAELMKQCTQEFSFLLQTKRRRTRAAIR